MQQGTHQITHNQFRQVHTHTFSLKQQTRSIDVNKIARRKAGEQSFTLLNPDHQSTRYPPTRALSPNPTVPHTLCFPYSPSLPLPLNKQSQIIIKTLQHYLSLPSVTSEEGSTNYQFFSIYLTSISLKGELSRCVYFSSICQIIII